jgi:PIN domain
MKPRGYIETSVISYLVSRPALDVITAGHQAATLQWWEQHRSRFELVISQFVVDEASEGDPVAAEKRVAALSGISVLPISEPQIIVLAQALLKAGALPQKAKLDALHIAVCAVPVWTFC